MHFAHRFVTLLFYALILSVSISAQQEPVYDRLEPDDLYMQAYLKAKDAEKKYASKNYIESFQTYEKARELLEAVAIYHPQWKVDIVNMRREFTEKAIAKVKPLAEKKYADNDKGLEELVEFTPSEVPNAETPKKSLPVRPRINTSDNKRLKSLNEEIIQLRNQLKETQNDRNLESSRLRRQIKELRQQRHQIAGAPVQAQMKRLTEQLDKITREKDVMKAALSRSRKEYNAALGTIAQLQTEQEKLTQKNKDLTASLSNERNSNNDVIRGLQQQVRQLKSELQTKDELLTKSYLKIAHLEETNRQANAQVVEISKEKTALLQERDEMASLLKMNQSKRYETIIEQNMELAKELREAREITTQISNDSNSSKETLIEAQHQLALIKQKMIALRHENKTKEKHLQAIKQKLERAEADLLVEAEQPDLSLASKEEIDTLKQIIKRQLIAQERREQSLEALKKGLQRLGELNPEHQELLEATVGEGITLSKKETMLLAERPADNEFHSSHRASASQREKAARVLQARISTYENLARKAYTTERFFVAQEIFETILDDHPGHIPSLVNLGVVQLHTNQLGDAEKSLNNAIAIRGEHPLPYAHYLLGVTYYKLRDFQSSLTELQTSILHAPQLASSHVYLGSVAGETGDYDLAIQSFQKALKINPTLSDPYYNLAVLYQSSGDQKKSKECYLNALENGASPDSSLEKKLGINIPSS